MTAINATKEFSYFNIASLLVEMAERKPDQKAVINPALRAGKNQTAHRDLTFQQLNRESDRLAAGLNQVGIIPGTRTVLMVRPGIDFFILTFALFKTGAVPVVVDPGMGIRRMVACLEEGRPSAFIGIPLAHVIRLLFPARFKTVKTFVTVGRRWFWGGFILHELRKKISRPFPMAETRKDDTAAILFTTGSTGPAKGAVYTHGTFGAQIRHIQSHFKIKENEIDLPTFPLFALFDPALGMTAVIPEMDPTRPAFVNPQKIIGAIEDYGVTNMFASPALLNRVGGYGKSKGLKLNTLKRVVSAGAPVAPSNIEQFSHLLAADADIHTPYGATEAVPIASITGREILSETRQMSEKGQGMCVGRPIDDLDIRIIQINDAPIDQWSHQLVVPDGEIGEITVKGDLVTRGYFENPHADRLSKIKGDGTVWHRMGDLGWKDQKGRIWFCGRKSHRVITAQKTLFSIPCEAIFNNHPLVFRSALIGIGPKPYQTPAVCIELKAGTHRRHRKKIKKELLELAAANDLTRDIDIILFHHRFPVDIRHNSKIFREKLAPWAERRLSRRE
jgi:acyl-CoA synthetase (AMP-forming)/AMP-acid ligase II